MPRRLDLVLVLAALLLLAYVLSRPSGPNLSPQRASATLTPGVANPDVTQATIGATICKSGWTRTIRPPVDYTNELKRKQLREYGRAKGISAYQEDHLISLELGGHATDPRNLWPEPYPRAKQVDGIENRLNADVCSGKLTLARAQIRESRLKHTAG